MTIARQRLVVLGALLALVAAVVAWPQVQHPAVGQDLTSSKPYVPFNCASATTTDNRRESFQLKGSAGDFNAAGRVFPCISGVPWRMTAGNVNSGTANQYAARIDKVYARAAVGKSGGTVYWASNGSRGDLYQLSFDSLRFCDSATSPIAGCLVPGSHANSPKLGLTANSASAQADPRPTTPATLTISPDAAATLGGAGVTTELWVTGNSSFTVPKSQLPCPAELFGRCFLGLISKELVCEIAGTLINNTNCKITMSSFGSNFVQLLAEGGNWSIVGLDIELYYLVSHVPNPANPYTTVPSAPSIVLPRTTISVQ